MPNRTARLDYQPGSGPSPISLGRQSHPPMNKKIPASAPQTAVEPRKPATVPPMPPDAVNRLHALLTVLGSHSLGQSLGVQPSTIKSWLQRDTAPTADNLRQLAKVHKMIIGDENE